MIHSESLRVGLRALHANPLRTLLSTLGVIMGVGSLVSILSMADGVEQYARHQIERTTDLQSLTVTSKTLQQLDGLSLQRMDTTRLTASDLEAIQAAGPKGMHGILLVQGGALVRPNPTAQARGVLVTALDATVEPTTLSDQALTLRQGRFLSLDDLRQHRPVVVLGERAAQALGGTPGLVGSFIQIQDQPFEVVGVVPSRDGDHLDATIPFGVLKAGLSGSQGQPALPRIILSAARVEDVEPMLRAAKHHFSAVLGPSWSERVSIVGQAHRLQQVSQGLTVFKLLMGAITGVSLLVGGIGIMNVLLASVSERTREIGIRKAAGARLRDILVQFLAESVTITSIGAALGVVLGLAVAFLVAAFMRMKTHQPVHAAISMSTLLVAAAASITVGLVFGLYPAMRAARLSPMDAIRQE